MALIIDNSTPLTAPYTAGGVTEVIASGDFLNATVQITVDADGSESAPVYTFFGPGAVSLQAAAGTTIVATVVGAGPSSIDVAMNP